MNKVLCTALSFATVVALGAAGQTPPTPPPGQTPPPTQAPPPAQTPPAGQQQPGAVFKSAVDLVHLDVSVFDKSRRPVLGLTQADFTILEDGKPQDLSVFSEVDVPDAEEPPAKWMRTVSPDVRSNDLRDSRLFVIVLDDALIPGDQRMGNNAKQIVRDIVDKLGPTDMAAIVLTGDNRNTQDFTNDHGRLLAVLDKFAPGLANYTFGKDSADPQLNTPNTDTYFYDSAVGTLRNVADFLIAVPQRRKSLIWISPGVPLDFEATAPMLASGVGKGLADKEAMSRLIDDVQEVYRRAQRANVAVYPIDPSGLGGMEQYITSRLVGKMPANQLMEFAHKQATNQSEFISTIAENTGGHAVLNTNDYKEGIAQVFRENSSYYLLGFQPANSKADGKLRRIEVKVNKPGAEVRARTGYYAPEPVKVTETAKSASASPLATALASLLPNPDMPMQVTVVPFARVAVPDAPKDKKDKDKAKNDSKATSTVAIVLGAHQRAREDSATARVIEDVELQASAFTPEGTSRGSTRQTAHIVLRQGTTGEFGYEIVTSIDLPPGRYELRLATYSGALEKTGSVFTDVVVPDFAAAPLSLSGVIVNETPSIPSGPKDALRHLLPFQPTSNRDFKADDKITMFTRVYQGGKSKLAPVEINVKILDSSDAAVFEKTDTLDVAKFDGATRAAGYTTTVDPVKLKPGPHVITFTATMGKDTAKRDVRFTVR